GDPPLPIAPKKTLPIRSVPIKLETRIASACKICFVNTSIRAGPHSTGPVTASAINAPRCRGDCAGAPESMYRLSTASASQLNLAKGRIVIERTPNPITASGIVMASPALLPYSNAAATKHEIQTTALTPNKPNRASDHPSVATLTHIGPWSPLTTA